MRVPKSHFIGKKILLSCSLWDYPVEGIIIELLKEPIGYPTEVLLYGFQIESGEVFWIPVGDAMIRVLDNKPKLRIAPVVELRPKTKARTRVKTKGKTKAKTRTKTRARAKTKTRAKK